MESLLAQASLFRPLDRQATREETSDDVQSILASIEGARQGHDPHSSGCEPSPDDLKRRVLRRLAYNPSSLAEGDLVRVTAFLPEDHQRERQQSSLVAQGVIAAVTSSHASFVFVPIFGVWCMEKMTFCSTC